MFDNEDFAADFEAEESHTNAETSTDVEGGDDHAAEDSGGKDMAAPRARKGISRAMVRRIAAKTMQIHEMSDQDRALLAVIVGGEADPVGLATTIMTASRGAFPVIDDIQTVSSEGSEAERAIALMVMDSARLKTMWQVAHAASPDAVVKTIPRSQAKACLALASALSDDTIALRVAIAGETTKKW